MDETKRMVLPSWKIEEWNIFDNIIRDEETSTCKLEAWHPSFEEFCLVIMREWIRIYFEIDKRETGNRRDDLRFKASNVKG